MNITKRTKSEGTTVYQFRVFLSQSADGKQRTRSKTWQPPAGMTAKAAEKEAKRQAVIFENEVKQGRAALDARTKLSDVAREYIRNTEIVDLFGNDLNIRVVLHKVFNELALIGNAVTLAGMIVGVGQADISGGFEFRHEKALLSPGLLPHEKSGYLAIRFSSFSTPIIALSAEKSEDVAQRKMPCRHSSNVTPFPAKQAFTTKSPQRKR